MRKMKSGARQISKKPTDAIWQPNLVDPTPEHAQLPGLKWMRDHPSHATCPSSHVARRTHGSPARTNPSRAGTRTRSILTGFPQVGHGGTIRRTLGPVTAVM